MLVEDVVKLRSSYSSEVTMHETAERWNSHFDFRILEKQILCGGVNGMERRKKYSRIG